MKILKIIVYILISINALFLINPYWLMIGVFIHILLCLTVIRFHREKLVRYILFFVPLTPAFYWILMIIFYN